MIHSPFVRLIFTMTILRTDNAFRSLWTFHVIFEALENADDNSQL